MARGHRHRRWALNRTIAGNGRPVPDNHRLRPSARGQGLPKVRDAGIPLGVVQKMDPLPPPVVTGP